MKKKNHFFHFHGGVWCTAWARDNLLRRVIDLDDYIVYCDTDSTKLIEGYDKKVFIDYNKRVKEKIEFASKTLSIPIERFMPKDIHGNTHMLGIFEDDDKYDEFITQGAKKYAVTKWKKNKKIKDDDNVIKKGEDVSKVLEITVAGVPKICAKCLKKIEDFKDDLVFDFEHTNKNTLFYCENQDEFDLIDYQGNTYHVTDKTGCCLVPTTYVLGKALEYAELIEDESSKRAWFKE